MKRSFEVSHLPFLEDTAKTVFDGVITKRVSENSQFSSHKLHY